MSLLRDLDDELERLTGEREFIYSTQPRPGGATRYVFQGGRNYKSLENAAEYLRLRIEQAKARTEGQRGH